MSAESPVLLLADDSQDDCKMLQMALKKLSSDCVLKTVKDGEELMEYLRAQGRHVGARRPSLVFVDLNLPLKTGLEALEEIKATPLLRAIPVIIWTTSQNPSDILQSYRLGASTYFSKPDSFEDLTAMVGVILDYWFKTATLPPDHLG
jgi:CheY-like chemotaxis protein